VLSTALSTVQYGAKYGAAASLCQCRSSNAQAIALSYMLIVVMGNALGVLIAMTLHRCGQAAVGSPPVTQVVVDVLGILLTCLVCSVVYSTAAAPDLQTS
jgi:NhaP-type Na+/H+ or K+/H+ antiporter